MSAKTASASAAPSATASATATAAAPRRTLNFGAGPAVLPRTVLERVQAEMLDYAGTGCSLLELSHRSAEFMGLLARASADLRALMGVPANYRILFMQGGATSQFSAVVYNLAVDLAAPHDYIVTGGWSEKAAQEARRLGANVNTVFSTKATGHDGRIPPRSEWRLSADAAYVYYCDNETVHGVEMPGDFVEQLPAGVPVVCDMSSNFLSRPVDVSKYGVIYGGAQKNVGPAGVTLVIVREDLIGTRTAPGLVVPVMLDYKTCAENDSLYNTPPTFAIYVSGLVFEWLRAQGGVEAISGVNARKARLVYDVIAGHADTYRCTVAGDGVRSRMNVTFRVLAGGAPSAERERAFVAGAEQRGMIQLAGHRSVGGIRASLYNALDEAAAAALAAYMREFAAAPAR
ncbi:Phosphoserine transaminase [Polyrhizophydium stewartii]|uniref:Phosphoserine aminotransferase n=1 Tax=Polyrhizophydium stewartii TaxID=2732419 RepID=A0ABR4NI96_9FUNG|nr:hypothetical protein HK105_002019 [Polyrhizophydium stewartii]